VGVKPAVGIPLEKNQNDPVRAGEYRASPYPSLENCMRKLKSGVHKRS